MPYQAGYELQVSLLEQRKAGVVGDTLLMLEHDHVITHGRRGIDGHLLNSDNVLAGRDVSVVRTDRGGETTYHGPGQLVAYPILSIRELGIGPVAYVRLLEETTIQLLAAYGVQAHRVVGKTGVWIDGEPGIKVAEDAAPEGRKIAAIGVRVSGGVAMHGIALNVSTDVSMFRRIVPCGMRGLEVTTLELECGESTSVEDAGWQWTATFADILGYDLNRVSPSEIRAQRNELSAAVV